MNKKKANGQLFIALLLGLLVVQACKLPATLQKEANTNVPKSYGTSTDTTNTAQTPWKKFFTDPYLVALIDTALVNNQELNMVLQEVNRSKYEVRERKGEYLPFVSVVGGSGLEKEGRYTRHGAVDANTEIMPGEEFPEPFSDHVLRANFSWEIDIWKKLRNARKAAMIRYLSTVEGKNFMVTQLIAEIASSYYELMALDNQLIIVNQNLEIQRNALKVVRQQKAAAKVTELAVQRFEAEVLKNQSRRFYIVQQITETENRINFLVGRFPQPVQRNSAGFPDLPTDSIIAGVPAQLLQYRPDIRQAELELAANKLDIQVARADFYPSLDISANLGYQAFNPKYLFSPESILYNLAGDLMAPLVNRNAIKARYLSANANQVQAAYNYEQTILNAYIEVANELSRLQNLQESYKLKDQQAQTLTNAVTVSNNLFQSARADYLEVMLTQREALEAKMQLIEIKTEQMNTLVKVYQALGGGWK